MTEPVVATNRILTIPNVFSFARLLCIPIFVWLLFSRDQPVGAAGLLAGLGATDWVDGYIARHFNQVSDLGKILDPAADRLMLGTALVSLIVSGRAPLWVLWLILVREVGVSVVVLVLGAMGARRIDVTWSGKAGAFGLMFALPFFLWASGVTGTLHDVVLGLAWFSTAGGLIFGYYAAYEYVPLAKGALAAGRADRAAAAHPPAV
jgi:cardiolipin synthase